MVIFISSTHNFDRKRTVSMNNLLKLNEGDVFPIPIGDGVQVRVEDKAMFLGEIGEVGGQSAINLNKRIINQ